MCEPFVKLFQKSTWIVPLTTLKAYLISEDRDPKSVIDQTVWVIDSFKDGYIFGTAYVSLNRVPVSKMKLIGSITSQGDVLISFYSDKNVITAPGKFINLNGQWQFIMQMNTITDLNIIHWSYMVKTTPKKPTYRHLPGVGISVPEFIKSFNSF